MHFFDWKISKQNKDKSSKRKPKNSKKSKKKGSKKMYGIDDNNGWEKQADGTWAQKNKTGTQTYSFNDCKHEPFKGCKVGDHLLYPTQDKYVTPNMLSNFDIVCPLTDFGGGVNYNEFCGVILWIPIKDMTAPNHLRLRANAQRIVELMKAGNTVALWCIGSHGRTGTVLATCIGLCEPDIDPIDAVRERHCKKAVETQSQCEAVFKALGRELPEKWKPAQIQTKAYITEGKPWSDKHTSKYIVSGAKPCEYCKQYGMYDDPVHWYGQVQAHTDCYNKEQSKRRTQSEQKKETTLPENAVLGTGGEIVIPMDELPDAPQLATDEELLVIIKAKHPYFTKWSQAFQDIVNKAKVSNEVDYFGDKICIVCSRLVINPLHSEIIPLNQQNFLAHTKCADWKDDPDTEVLCKYCLLEEADDDGYCSMTCATMGDFQKAQKNNQTTQQDKR